jgi:hypothetical protein
MMAAAEAAMMSTMPPAAGRAEKCRWHDILFLFLSGISDTLPPFIQKKQAFP